MRFAASNFGCVCVSLVALQSALGQALPTPAERLENSRRHHEWVDIEAPGGRKVHTFIAYPESDQKATTVIVIHENKGLTDWVRGVADQLAEAGYIAIAPDLLSGTAPGGGNTPEYGSQDAATQGIGKLPPQQVLADLDAAYQYVKRLQSSNGVVAVGGFCWGGGKTFAYAAHNPNIAAAFVFYGVGPRDNADFAKINAPVYGFYGEKDNRITGAISQVAEKMKAADKKYDPVTYAGAGHGFMRQGETVADTANADRKARDEAWVRLKKILNELKPSG
jgi:carboxymethylenebutenolidase